MPGVGRFRKKALVIEAIQLTWANWNEICAFVPKPWFVRGVWLGPEALVPWNPSPAEPPLPENDWPFGTDSDDLELILRTLESQEFLATGNDWIIRGIGGEFYPCKPDIFAATYEPASDEEPS